MVLVNVISFLNDFILTHDIDFLFLTKLAMTWGTRSFFLNCVLKNTNSLTQRLICKPMSTGEYKFHELLLWNIEWSTPASTSTFAAHQTSFPRVFSISLTCTIFPSLSQIPHSWLHFNFCYSGSCCSDKQWQVIWSLALLCFAPYFHPSWGSWSAKLTYVLRSYHLLLLCQK